MMILPKGITDFNYLVESQPLQPWVKLRKSIVQSIYDCGEKVLAEIPCENQPTPNYHFVKTSRLSVVVHINLRYIACVSNIDSNDCELKFVDWPELQMRVEKYGQWNYLTSEFLMSEVTSESITQLHDTEQSDITYWKPENLGHLIFNHWD